MSYRSILFVDDDVMTQWTMTEVLTNAGFDVTSACRGKEAMAQITRDAEFDALVTEIDLPDGVSGLRLVQRWRERLGTRPVILIGATGCVPLGHLGLREIFVEKPFAPDQLLKSILGAIDEAHYCSMAQIPSWPVHHVH